jgi:hypothetical protein
MLIRNYSTSEIAVFIFLNTQKINNNFNDEQ